MFWFCRANTLWLLMSTTSAAEARFGFDKENQLATPVGSTDLYVLATVLTVCFEGTTYGAGGAEAAWLAGGAGGVGELFEAIFRQSMVICLLKGLQALGIVNSRQRPAVQEGTHVEEKKMLEWFEKSLDEYERKIWMVRSQSKLLRNEKGRQKQIRGWNGALLQWLVFHFILLLSLWPTFRQLRVYCTSCVCFLGAVPIFWYLFTSNCSNFVCSPDHPASLCVSNTRSSPSTIDWLVVRQYGSLW